MARTNKPKPWELQPGETAKAFEAFCLYRDMGTERSIAKVGEKLGKNKITLEQWSAKNGWVDRATAWDGELDRIRQQEEMRLARLEVRRMRERQAKDGMAMQEKGRKALEFLIETDLSANDVVKLIVEGGKHERIARGDVGEVIEERDGGKAQSPVMFYMPDNHRQDAEPAEEEAEE